MRKQPLRPDLVKKILAELQKHPKGVWIRKLARNINEPMATVYKYVSRDDYAGRYLVTERTAKELGGHIVVRTNYKKSAEIWQLIKNQQ
ncbi:MAG: hypothetical protein HY519_03635 [Candidatus Aenigmarchaeota archaeon]|nr:hypothetical protein [Candidatus Aenigmarchaeota archaeon]